MSRTASPNARPDDQLVRVIADDVAHDHGVSIETIMNGRDLSKRAVMARRLLIKVLASDKQYTLHGIASHFGISSIAVHNHIKR